MLCCFASLHRWTNQRKVHWLSVHWKLSALYYIVTCHSHVLCVFVLFIIGWIWLTKYTLTHRTTAIFGAGQLINE